MKRTSSKLAVLLGLLMVAGILKVSDANPAMAQTQTVGAWSVSADPGLDGSAPQWQSIPPVYVATTAQQVTPPMGGGSINRVALRAVHWDDRLYVMLEWVDLTSDTVSERVEHFTDAAAIQFPAEAASTVPAICMGQADQAVNIWQWRANLQEGLPGLPEGGYVDFYPSEDDLYFTAREAGNPLSQTDAVPVLNLVAGGFGTLTAGETGDLGGMGVYSDHRWMVVFSRPYHAVGELQPVFSPDDPIDVAVAVWDGAKGERNGIKSVSSFFQMVVSPEAAPRRDVSATDTWPAYQPTNPMAGFVAVFLGLLVASAVIIWFMVARDQKDPEVDSP